MAILTAMEIAYTTHARDMLAERTIPGAWVVRAMEVPTSIERHSDGTTHYLATVPERGGRILRVVVNADANPPLVVTVFFDRRLRRQS